MVLQTLKLRLKTISGSVDSKATVIHSFKQNEVPAIYVVDNIA